VALDQLALAMTPLRRLALPLLALALATGCGRYVAGTGNTPPFRTIEVAAAPTSAVTPLTRPLLQAALARELAETSRVRHVASGGEAILAFTVLPDTFTPAVGVPTDTGRSDKIEMEVAILATLTDARTGNVYFADRPFRTRLQVFPGSAQTDAVFQEMPVAARDLARQVARAVTATW
jgi:hypothetical protein